MKDRYKSHNLLAYEALLRRLKRKYRGHPIINNDYQRYAAGFRGEKNVDYKLRILPPKEYLLYYDLRLNNQYNFFQIDTLILTEKFMCIIEIKNLKGKLAYDSKLKQFTQITEGKEIGYQDPIMQVNTQKENLIIWLEKYGLSKVPIETIVVLANPATIIENVHNDPMVYDKLIHAESLTFHLKNLNLTYDQKLLNQKTIKKLHHIFLQEDRPLKSNLLQKYNIQDHHLIKGVPCLHCDHSFMDRFRRKWHCHQCSYSNVNAHQRTILDYFLLHQDTITNNQCQELLQISSRKSAYIFLQSMKIKETGKTRGKKYHAPHIHEFPQDSGFSGSGRSIMD